MSTQSTSGYLVLSDISGFTSYVAQTELEHSQEVLTELLEMIVARAQPLLNVVKLEGDAVFAYAPLAQVKRGESLLELIDATYVAFRGRLEGIKRRTTCQCNACRALPMLDLKFITHCGPYMVQSVSGITDLVGSDVNLVHRLLKNHVGEATGWNAYALFTEACLDSLGLELEGLHRQDESYEHLGTIATYSLDLRARYDELTANREVFVKPEEADGKFSLDIPAPPALVWDWLNDPQNRSRYMEGTQWITVNRQRGRVGAGAANHCAHGKGELTVENILDWRPFDYYTAEILMGKDGPTPLDHFVTYHYQPLSDGAHTRFQATFKLTKPNLMGKGMMKMMPGMVKKSMQVMADALLEHLAGQEAPQAAGALRPAEGSA